MHLKRLITAIVALPLLIGLIGKGGVFSLTILIGVVCVIAMWEYYRIVFHKTRRTSFGVFSVVGYIFGLLIIWAAYEKSLEIILGLLVLNTLFVGFAAVFQYKSGSDTTGAVAKQILGVIYIPVLLACLVLIRQYPDGVRWIFLLLILVFSNDTGAFYTGTFLGKHKLCPMVSPGKTVEGAVGGLLVSVFAGLMFRHFFLPALPLALSVCFFVCVSVAGPVGDLFESVLKREGEIKDSGAILPGHGGILDRIDALLFAAPVAYLFRTFIL